MKVLCSLILLLFVQSSFAQNVGINSDNSLPDNSAMLDIKSTQKGLLIPRLTKAQRDLVSLPATGLLVYQTDNTPGIYLNSGTPALPSWTIVGPSLTGTANYLVKFTTTATGGISQIYDDGTNVGIGTTNPNQKLEVNGTAKAINLQMTGGAANGYVIKGDGSGNASWVDPTTLPDGRWTISGFNQYSAVSGNVGIGVISPAQKLEVNGTAKATNLQMTSGATNGYVIKSDANGTASWVDPTTLPDGRWTVSGLNQYSAVNGNVGIGVISPAQKLEVNGTAKATNLQMTSGATNTYVLQSDAAGNGSWVNPTTLANGNWTTSGLNQYSALSGNVGIGVTSPAQKLEVSGTTKTTNLQMTSGAANGYVVKSDASGNASWVDPTTLPDGRWTVSGLNQYSAVNGNVGIGVISPAQKLEVSGTTKTTNLQMTSGATNTYVLQSDATGNGSWVNPTTLANGNWTTNGLNQYSALSGNVGIGVTSPAQKLEVSGTTKTTNLQMTSGATNGYVVKSDASGNASWVDPTTLPDGRWTISGLNQYSALSGNVGVGVTSPTQKLEVSGTTKTTNLQMTSGATNTYVLQSDATGNGSWVNPTTLANGNWTTSGLNQYSALSGNVGIGVTSPAQKLEVNGTAKATNLQMTSGAANGYVVKSDASGNASWVDPTTLPNGSWTINGVNQYSVVSGNVGIGTGASALYPFHVKSANVTATTYSENSSAFGAGVYGFNSANSAGNGVVGSIASAAGNGVLGVNSDLNGVGIFGLNSASASSSTGIGVYGKTVQSNGSGIYGINSSPFSGSGSGTGNGNGVYGSTTVSAGSGVYGTNSTSAGVGVSGVNSSNSTSGGGAGVFGLAAQYGVYGNSTGSNGYGVVGLNSTTAGTGTGYGTYGSTGQSQGAGIVGFNTNTSGTAIMGAGNNLTPTYLIAGSGGAFSGVATGVYAKATTAGIGQSVYTDEFSNIVRVNYWSGATQYKINGGGSVSTTAAGAGAEKVTLHCAETPEIYFQDFGEGKLVNGRMHIDIDPIFSKNVVVSDKHPLRVYIQPEGDCKGVYVTNKTQTGFDVVELNGGTSNISFQWTITCNRADEDLGNGRISKNADTRFEPAPKPEPTASTKSGLK